MTDAELLRAWHGGGGGGDRSAGEALFERHYESVSRFFRNKVAEPADLVQRTFLACLENIDRFRGDASFRTFLFAIATNVLRKHYRANAGPRGKVDLGSVSIEALEPSPSRIVANTHEKRLLLRALRRLTMDQQILLELYYWEQMKITELAAILELPIGTVKTRMRTARRQLEEHIEVLAAAPGLVNSTVTRLDEWARQLRDQLGQD